MRLWFQALSARCSDSETALNCGHTAVPQAPQSVPTRPDPTAVVFAGQVVQAAQHSRPANQTVRRVMLTLAVVGMALAAAGLALRFVTVSSPILLGVVATTPYLTFAGVLGVAGAVLTRTWWLAVIATGAVAALVTIQVPLFVASNPPRDAHDLVVLTANLKLGEANPKAVAAATQRDRVDVFVAEELTPNLAEELAPLLRARFPYSHTAPGGGPFGTGVWSRYPLRDATTVPDYSFALITARVQVPGEPVDLVGLHTAGPVPDSSHWQHDMARLPGLLRSLPRSSPIVVAGDFNATPDTAQFRAVLNAGFADAADQAGAGVTATFPADEWFGPLIAIDHVLTRHAVARSANTVSIAGSDHRALLVTVALPRDS